MSNAGTAPPPRRAARWDPVLLSMILWTALAAGLFFVFSGNTTRQVQVYWTMQVPLDVVLAYFSWRVQRIAAGAVRRFWRILTAVGLLFLLGDTFQTVETLLWPAGRSTTGGAVQATCLGIGQVAIVVSMLTQPGVDRTGRERLALWLDSAAVLVGGAVISWCFAVAPTEVGEADVLATVAATGIALVAAFAAVRMVLAGNAPMNKIAAIPMIAAAGVGATAIFLVPTGPDAVVPPAVYGVLFLVSLLISSGPRLQELLAQGNSAPFGSRRKKPYSLMPYGSIVVAFGALIAILPQGMTVRLWGVVAGVILITALVAARQLVAFHDNMRLIRRLDATLGDLREHESRLRDQALFDGLTRLPNRTNFGEQVTHALAAAALGAAPAPGSGPRSSAAPASGAGPGSGGGPGSGAGPGGGVALLLIDLDNFKMINDTMGHAAGDDLLVVVAERLRRAIRAGDSVARLGGDEFAVLLREVEDAGDAPRTARRILDDLAQPIRIQQNDIVVRASIGVADAGPGATLESLLRDADIAMYAAKDAGKGDWVRYAPDMGERIQRGAELTRRLSEALAGDQFHLDYQPIFEIGSGRLTGTEALVRWRPDPAGPPISPGEFIPIAEESGLIVPLGRWVLWESCRQAGEWRRDHPAAADQVMSVNVAGRQLREAGFTDEVAAALAAADLPARCLSIEVTETAVLDDEMAVAALHALRGLGVQLALDDFGTAASSLGLLLTCPVTTLKLDRSFVENVTTVDRQRAVATAVSQIAAALRLKSVAEGIETPEQARLLQDLGYHYAQGFLFARPMPPRQVAELWTAAATQLEVRLT